MSKLVKDGQVAVLVSGGFGAGWSTWGDAEQALDGEIAQAIIDGKSKKEIHALAAKNWPHAYTGGLDQCSVQWVEEGSDFEIEEYDGSELLHVIGRRNYLRA